MDSDWIFSDQVPFSSFTHLLDTNYSPTSQESKDILTLLEGSQANLERIQMQIKKLEIQQLQIQSFIAKHRALLSPIRRVPADILGEIFYHSLPTDSLPTRCSHTSPLLLSAVCRTWRDVLLGAPWLWRAIHIQFPVIIQDPIDDRFQMLVEKRLKGIKTWLSRSGSLPLSLSLYISLDLQYLEDSLRTDGPEVIFRMLEPIEPILELLLSYFARWEHVTFQVPAALLRSFQRADLSSQVGQNVTLTSLNLLRSWITPSPIQRDSWDDLNSISRMIQIPGLKSLSFHNEKINLLELPSRWPQLADLAITASRHQFVTKPLTALRILPRCAHSLVSLTLDLVLESQMFAFPGLPPPLPPLVGDNWPEGTIELPRLITLVVRFDIKNTSILDSAHPTIKRFFDSLLAPSLEHLSTKIFPTLTHIQPGTPWSGMEVPFLTFLERSACELLSLDVCMPVGDRRLGECLQRVGRELRTLNVIGDHYYRLKGRPVDFESEARTSLITERFIRWLADGNTNGSGSGSGLVGSTASGSSSSSSSSSSGDGGGGGDESGGTLMASHKGMLCPNLEEMRLLMVDPERVADLLALASAESALGSSSKKKRKLKLFEVDFRRVIPDSAHVSEQLERLRKGGMTVRWRSVRGRGFEEDVAVHGLGTVKNDTKDLLLTDEHFPVVY